MVILDDVHPHRSHSVLASCALASLWGLFAYRHVHAFAESGQWMYVVFCCSETLQAALFMLRARPVSVSAYRSDWLIAIGGTFAPLLFVPAVSGPTGYAGIVILIGAVLQIVGLLSLNRSFAIVPAQRQIKTRGVYRIVRHPIYASYVVLCSGYLLGNPTTWNIAVYVIVVGCNIARALLEERHLSRDSAYRRYMERVRYRLVPYVF